MNTCWHCGRDIEDRGHPVAKDNQFAWHPVWAHVPGGYLHCFPQRGAESPVATLWDGEDPPYDWR